MKIYVVRIMSLPC